MGGSVEAVCWVSSCRVDGAFCLACRLCCRGPLTGEVDLIEEHPCNKGNRDEYDSGGEFREAALPVQAVASFEMRCYLKLRAMPFN